MLLYDKNDNLFDTTGFKEFNEGKCAKIFRKDDVILKKYKIECPFRFYFSRKVFEELKKLDLDGIVKLYDYYYNNKGKLGHVFLPEVYTMEYIDNPNITLLEQDKEYLLDIISRLEHDINILSNNKIELGDAHNENIIFRDNDAKIIDIDSFTMYKRINDKRILLNNKKELLYYVKSTLKHELKKREMYDYRFECKFNYEYNNALNYETVTDYLNKVIDDGKIEYTFTK